MSTVLHGVCSLYTLTHCSYFGGKPGIGKIYIRIFIIFVRENTEIVAETDHFSVFSAILSPSLWETPSQLLSIFNKLKRTYIINHRSVIGL